MWENLLKQTGFTFGSRFKVKSGYLQLIGVVKNQSLNAPPGVYVSGYRYPVYFEITLKYPGFAGEKLHAFVQKWEYYLQNKFSHFYFLDGELEEKHELERNVFKLFLFFSLLAGTSLCFILTTLDWIWNLFGGCSYNNSQDPKQSNQIVLPQIDCFRQLSQHEQGFSVGGSVFMLVVLLVLVVCWHVLDSASIQDFSLW